MPECPDQWKLDVNDRYQHAVGIVTSLSTAAIVLPVLFLRDVVRAATGRSIADAFNAWVYAAWALLLASILGAIVYYYASAKWVKLAWGKTTDMFGVVVNEPRVELILDISYFIMMAGFVVGFGLVIVFVSSFIP